MAKKIFYPRTWFLDSSTNNWFAAFSNLLSATLLRNGCRFKYIHLRQNYNNSKWVNKRPVLKQDGIASDIINMDYWKLFSLVSLLRCWLWDIMLRIIKTDKVNRVVTLEMDKKDLENIVESVDSMSDKQQRILLENLPSEDRDRQKLDDYKALREELRKVLQVLINWLIRSKIITVIRSISDRKIAN